MHLIDIAIHTLLRRTIWRKTVGLSMTNCVHESDMHDGPRSWQPLSS